MVNKRGIAIFLLLCMALSALCFAADDYKNELAALNSKYDQLEKQQTAIQKELDKAKTDKAKQLALKKQLDNQIVGVREQIGILTSKVTLLEENIIQKENELLSITQDIEDSSELLRNRLRVMYRMGNATVLGLVLGADNFTEFLTRARVAQRIAHNDKQVIEKMSEDLRLLEEIKADIEQQKADMESTKGQLSSKQTQLGGQLSQTNNMIQDLEAMEKAYLQNKAKLEKQMKEVEAEVKAIYDQIKSEGEYTGGIMLWPVAGHNKISSYYGWRFQNTDYHTGIDVAGTNALGQGIYGKPILAASDGKVVFTQKTFVYGRGYGIYAIIDHGGGVSTLYAHQSGLKVNVGEYVKRGQTIGYVGSTGWSTGPHLHFEVRINGVHTNPLPYLKP